MIVGMNNKEIVNNNEIIIPINEKKISYLNKF
jgi:hypothetical protein